MPQLDFSWWLLNFILVWSAVITAFILITNTHSPSNITNSEQHNEIAKTSTNWQWS